jgi:SAC3/GANP family
VRKVRIYCYFYYYSLRGTNRSSWDGWLLHQRYSIVRGENEETAVAMSSNSVRLSKAKRKAKKSSGKNCAPSASSVYLEDIGTAGIKKQKVDRTKMTASFKFSLNARERRRRSRGKNFIEPFALYGVALTCRCCPQARFAESGNSFALPQQLPLNSLDKSLSSGRRETKEEYLKGRLIGENVNLEKPYLRLTTFPRKQDVRPLKVLQRSLVHIKNRYKQDEDFHWANEQLKSLRQDLTVQRIRNRYVLSVYETHARILLEHGDLNEFNQCQTMLRSLTQGGKLDASEMNDISAEWSEDEGTMDDAFVLVQTPEVADEFRAYGVIYALVRNFSTQLKMDLVRAMESVKECGNCVETSSMHAIQVVNAVGGNDFRTFFRLYEDAPNMSGYLLDFLVKRVRDGAFESIVAAYRPHVSVEELREWLSFSDVEETRRYLKEVGAVFVQEENQTPFWVDCKLSMCNTK